MRSSIMATVVFFILIIVPTSLYSDEAQQTDWSGGDGVLWPVLDWGNKFWQSSDINWSTYPGSLLLSHCFLENIVDEDFNGAWSVYSEDIDGDGDMDVLGAASQNDDITWWENIDGSGTSWAKHTIDGNFDHATSVYSEDIDSDGDMDVLGAAYYDDDITWWENIDGLGTSWTEHTVDGDFDGALSVYSEDIDGDSDMDVLGAAYYDDDITWWENIDGLGTYWAEHNIDGDFDGAYSVYSEDIDDDGDMDVLGVAFLDDDITWWENSDTGAGIYWTEHIIDGDFSNATSVYSEDIDGDGDMDVLGTAYSDIDITWWENINGSGTSWTEHTIDGDFYGAESIYSEDIDDDGDMDVLGASSESNEFTLWENIDGSGTSWTEHNVDGVFYGAFSVYSEDIDGDGDMDFLGAVWGEGEIIWWRFDTYSPVGTLESSILDLGNDPCWGAIDWSASTPFGTSVSFLVRASDNAGNMGDWSDTLTAPCSLEGILNDYDSYFQYKVLLETVNPETTPSLYDVTLSWDPLGVWDDPQITEYLLFGVEPNPSSESVSIGFAVPELSPVELYIYDLTGRLVIAPAHGEYSPGVHQVQTGELTPGLYFCRMISGDFTATQRFVVIE